jgi:hypothetical protein
MATVKPPELVLHGILGVLFIADELGLENHEIRQMRSGLDTPWTLSTHENKFAS